MHGDFFNGWEKGAIPQLLESCPNGEYGNQNIGDCPMYQSGLSSTPRGKCKLKQYFKENIETPGKNLVGCNPITRHGQTPLKLAIAALHVCTDTCGLSNGDSSSPDDSYEMPSYSAPSSSPSSESEMSIQPVYTSAAAPTTTSPTSTVAATTEAAPAYGPPPSYGGPNPWEIAEDDAEDDDDQYDAIVTEWVQAKAFVTTTVVSEATAYAKRDVHNHMNAHRRRHF